MTDSSGAGARVLVVEDFAALRSLMVKLLSAEGYDVVAVDTVARAVEVCTSEHVDLLITDYRLAAGTGAEVARHAVAHNPHVGVLFVSGSSRSALDLDVPGARVSFLQKPFDIDDLIQCARQILSRPNAATTTP